MRKGFIKSCLSFGLGAAALVAQPARAGIGDWHVNTGGPTFDSNFTAMWVPYGTPGVTPNPNNSAAPAKGTTNGIDWTIWDNYGPHGNASTGSHHNLSDYGGQQFDAKAMYVRNDNIDLFVGIVTGFNPAGFSRDGIHYALGDLAIDPDPVHHTARLGVVTLSGSAGDSGTTSLVSGGTWNVPNAATGWNSFPTNYLSGGSTVANDIQYTYSDLGISYLDAVTGKSVEQYLLEFTIPLSELGTKNGQSVSLSWGPNCGNDIIGAVHQVSVPEPAGLTALGSLSLLALRRRNRRA